MKQHYKAHMCVGPSCWECGEPDFLRRMRHAMASALIPEVGQERAHHLAQKMADTIREETLDLVTHGHAYDAVKSGVRHGMRTACLIDPDDGTVPFHKSDDHMVWVTATQTIEIMAQSVVTSLLASGS